MTATKRDPFYLTGDSHADLDRMAAAVGHVDRARAFTHDPGPQVAGMAAEPREDVGRLVDRRTLAEDKLHGVISGLELLLGPAVAAPVRQAYADVAAYAGGVESWQMRRGDQLEGRVAHLREIVDSRDRDVDRARDLAARLEEELVLLRDPWIGRYLEALEQAVGDEARDAIVVAVNTDVAANPPAPEAAPVMMLDSPGLPVVDDATLDAGQVIFRRGDTTIAVGRLDRIFGPLDTATEIALGADSVDAPGDAAHPLDELEMVSYTSEGVVSWPDGTQWTPAIEPGAWMLLSTPQNHGEWAHVACPQADPSPGSRRVNVGATWGPYGDPPEVPRAQPPGPPTPPRPPHHQPFA